MKTNFSFVLLIICGFLFASSCSQSTVSPTETSTATVEIPTETSVPTVPPTETSTPKPTLDAALEPVHGILELADGYHPNPLIKPLLFGGKIDLSAEFGDEACEGFVESAADMAIDWGGGGFLRIFFLPDKPANSSLAIKDPQGSWYCSDDSFETLNPAVDFENALAGQFKIWVGGEAEGQTGLGKLYFTQVEDIDPGDLDFSGAVQGEKLNRDAPAKTAEISLIEGFSPDPMVIEMVAGGVVDHNLALEFPMQIADLGDSGFTHPEPDVRLHWQGSGYLKIFFVADNGIDTVLFIGDPNNMDNQNDARDYEGVIYEDPLLEFMSSFNGVYNIWVNSFSPSVLVPGKLYITSSTEFFPGNPGD